MKRGGSGGGDDGSGEIIQVQGGHIVRATARKDRHSKVYTSKGPRDRRVRLSAHTAIQFYDVQDRLGYDRPSKAVDWLITKARTAIENLAELPNHPATAVAPPGSDTTSNPGSSEPSNAVYQPSQQSIADSMRSFFPVSPEDSSSSLMSTMQGFGDGRMSRQQAPLSIGDLGLSLHSSQHQNMNHQMLFSGSNNGEMFESSYHKSSDQSSWNPNEGEGINSRVGFIFNPHSVPQQLYLSQNSSISSSAFSQREPLQSNGYSSLLNHHAWNNANQRQMASVEHHHQATHQPFNQSAFYNLHFRSDFQVPARIRGEENHGGGDIGNKHD